MVPVRDWNFWYYSTILQLISKASRYCPCHCTRLGCRRRGPSGRVSSRFLRVSSKRTPPPIIPALDDFRRSARETVTINLRQTDAGAALGPAADVLENKSFSRHDSGRPQRQQRRASVSRSCDSHRSARPPHARTARPESPPTPAGPDPVGTSTPTPPQHSPFSKCCDHRKNPRILVRAPRKLHRGGGAERASPRREVRD